MRVTADGKSENAAVGRELGPNERVRARERAFCVDI